MQNPFSLAVGEPVVSLLPTLQAVHAHTRRDQQRVISELTTSGLRVIWIGEHPFARERELQDVIRKLVEKQEAAK